MQKLKKLLAVFVSAALVYSTPVFSTINLKPIGESEVGMINFDDEPISDGKLLVSAFDKIYASAVTKDDQKYLKELKELGLIEAAESGDKLVYPDINEVQKAAIARTIRKVYSSENQMPIKNKREIAKVRIKRIIKYSDIPKTALTEIYAGSPRMTMFSKMIKEEIIGENVFIRGDLNVPLKKDKDTGEIVVDDKLRIVKLLEDDVYPALNKGAGKVVLLSHLGRPDKEVEKLKEKKGMPMPEADAKIKIRKELSMKPVVKVIEEELRNKGYANQVIFANDCIGAETEDIIKNAPLGAVIVLENLRFHPEEQSKDKDIRQAFSDELYKLADLVVFGASSAWHNKDASLASKPQGRPFVVGGIVEEDVKFLYPIIFDNKPMPFVLIFGGGPKFPDKVDFLKAMLSWKLDGWKGDKLFIGSGPAPAFQVAKKLISQNKEPKDAEENDIASLKKILGEKEDIYGILATCKEILQSAKLLEIPVYLPLDTIEGKDIGPKTQEYWKKVLESMEGGTIAQNGSVGMSDKGYPEGSKSMVEVFNELASRESERRVEVICLGADTCNMIKDMSLELGIDNIKVTRNPMGGAGLKAISNRGEKLPALDACMIKDSVSASSKDASKSVESVFELVDGEYILALDPDGKVKAKHLKTGQFVDIGKAVQIYDMGEKIVIMKGGSHFIFDPKTNIVSKIILQNDRNKAIITLPTSNGYEISKSEPREVDSSL